MSPPDDNRAAPAIIEGMKRDLLLAAIAGILMLPGHSSAQSPDTHRHGFQDADKWSMVFDDPARDAWQKPHEVIEALKLTPNASVADIGSGTGYFAVRLAHRVPNGSSLHPG